MKLKSAKVYLVGGACRDILLGVESKDNDYVVVGSSIEEMLELGFKQVGADFPVFLHPSTGEEYALARTERKSGEGYNGFECNWEGVSLEDDLSRRDLTMNAIALELDVEASEALGEPVTKGTWIDPFGGMKDIEDKVFRPVSDAFKEDPLRVLRVARFSARYPSFEISDELKRLCKSIENSKGLEYLTPERVWLETEKAFKEDVVGKYFEFLVKYKMPFTKVFRSMKHTVEGNPYHEEDNVFVHTMMVTQLAHSMWKDPEITLACLLHDIAKPYCYYEYGSGHGHDDAGVEMVEDWCSKFKVPVKYKQLAKLVCKYHQKVHSVLGRNSNQMAKPKSVMKLFEETSALTKPERFSKILKACMADSHGRIGVSAQDEYIQLPYLGDCLQAARGVNTKNISSKMLKKGKSGILIGEQIRIERIAAIRGVQNQWKKKLLHNT